MVWRVIRYTVLAMPPIIMGVIIDALENGTAQSQVESYILFLIGFTTIYLLSLLNNVFNLEIQCIEKAIRGLTLFSIRHLNNLSLNWHERQGSGGKLQQVMTGRRGFTELMRYLRWNIIPLVGNVVTIFISVFLIDIPVFYIPIYIGFVILYLFCSWFFARGYLGLFDKFNEKFEKLLSGVYEFVSSIRTVKAFHLSNHINDKAKTLEEEGQEAMTKTHYLNYRRWTICNMISGTYVFTLAIIGFYWTVNDTMTVGVYAATFFLAFNIVMACEYIGDILEKIYEHGNGIHRLVKTLQIRPESFDLKPLQTLPADWKSLSLSNVSYAYDKNTDQGIKNISFSVERGQKIAFVGNSGAGKSTLVKILMKQMLPNEGNLTINDTDVSHIPTADWLRQIGFVPQDVELFNLSIRDNIVIDRDDIDEALLNNVIEQSALDEFIDSLPDGLDTIIGERGIKLSGGQRQRLGIARALVRQAPIMIFDEATSSLDSLSEEKIQTAIENSFSGRTVFVIAHRLSTIRNVDTIIVLDQGRIIEEGSFDQLIAKNGHFAKLWSIQSNTSAMAQEVL